MEALRASGAVPPAGAPPGETSGGQFVTKAELDASMNTILEAVKGIAQPGAGGSGPHPSKAFSVTHQQEPERKLTSSDASPEKSNATLNPIHQAIFDDYFDPEDGFTARFDYPYFTIIVPLNLSNADAAWKKYYKVDSRVKFLKYDNIEGGMRDWCKMVAGNLKYNKLTKLK